MYVCTAFASTFDLPAILLYTVIVDPASKVTRSSLAWLHLYLDCVSYNCRFYPYTSPPRLHSPISLSVVPPLASQLLHGSPLTLKGIRQNGYSVGSRDHYRRREGNDGITHESTISGTAVGRCGAGPREHIWRTRRCGCSGRREWKWRVWHGTRFRR